MQEGDHHAVDLNDKLEEGKEPEESVPKSKPAKKNPKASKKKQKVPKDMVLNDNGELVSSREYLLEKT